MKLEPPASHHLSAAQGWVELGSGAEAEAELNLIQAEFQTHPEVMEIRWQALAQMKRWQECVELGGEIIRIAPGRSSGWIHRSYALHELGDTEGALHTLLPALNRFPDSWLIRYNMACYHCRLNRPDEGFRLFEQACRLGDVGHIKNMALHDEDLRSIRDRISTVSQGGYV